MKNFITSWAPPIACLIFGLSMLIWAAWPSRTSQGAKDVSGKDGAAEVKLVVLEDGTKCAVLVGYNKGSISCNWK